MGFYWQKENMKHDKIYLVSVCEVSLSEIFQFPFKLVYIFNIIIPVTLPNNFLGF